jgi:hypothetical protein
MQDAFIPLLLGAGIFFLFTLWRVRPLFLLKSWRTKRRGAAGALREIQARIAAAADGRARAIALCDAADIVAKRAAGKASAEGLYLRATRSDPTSADVVARAVSGLARRPRALESLLWRYLATVRWNDSATATATALDALRALYEGPLRNALRARALANARDALK